jgi:hypothetical protein
MAVARYLTISGRRALEPGPLAAAAELHSTPDDFWGRANSITCPLGIEPGSAWILLSRVDGGTLDRNAAHSLSWLHEFGTTTWQGYYLHSQKLINVDGDGMAAVFTELRDKREVLKLSAINRRFNVMKPLPFTLGDGADRIRSKYFNDSLNAGSLYTWAQAWAGIWNELPAIAGAAPALPFDPPGHPKNFAFSGHAWCEAVPQFLAAIGCTIGYDPVADTFSVVRLGAPQTGYAAAITANSARRLFDAKPRQALNAMKPGGWLMLNPKQQPSNDGGTDPGRQAIVPTAIDGAAAGTGKPLWLRTPATFCEDSEGNTEELDTFNAALAAELTAKASGADERQEIFYSGLLTSFALGSQVTEVVWRDYGDEAGAITEIRQFPFVLPECPRQNLQVETIIRVEMYETLAIGGSAMAKVVTYDHPEQAWEADTCQVRIVDAGTLKRPLAIGEQAIAKYHFDSEQWEALSVQPCLPPQLIRDVRLTSVGLIKDVWFTDRPCDEYVPYMIGAGRYECYVPYTPGPGGEPTSNFFDDEYTSGEGWTFGTDWSIHADYANGDTKGAGTEGPDNGILSWAGTIGSGGGFVQFDYNLQPGPNSVFVFRINGTNVIATSSGGSWITAGPFALPAGAVTLQFEFAPGVSFTEGSLAIDNVIIWGEE